MHVLIDSNVLLRIAKPDHPQHSVAVSALARLHQLGRLPTLVPQIACEYYVVATRPVGVNGLGWSASQAIADLDEILARFLVLADTAEQLAVWRSLVEKHGIQGKTAHDTRLVAAMQTHGIHELLTFNLTDFSRYSDEIRVVSPLDLSTAQASLS